MVGHSMGGMLAARFATQYPKAVERLVIYNPIGLTDGRFDRPMPPIDELYRQTLKADYQSIRASLGRYVAHNPKAWNAEFEALRAHPLLVDAQRRVAEAGHGTDANQPDALCRPGGL